MASSSSCISPWKYDVFLSFRGEDTRKNFVDHLYAALHQKGIDTFKDDKELERGKSISPGLLKAIRESRFALIIFSRNYASSSWCLDELVEIIECSKNLSTGQTALPIFYDVDPSQVRKQKGSFAEAFAKHEETYTEDKEKVQRWRAALVEAANLSGWDLNHVANGYEVKFIRKIIQQISRELRRTPLHVAKYEVGIDSRANKLITLLDYGLEGVRVVGICGTGGIGKTTIAKAGYNLIFNKFESCCFLGNVREVSKQHGLSYLQQELLNEILMEKDLKICNVDKGVNVIKSRLRSKRILVVLDDVDDLKQLESLAGGHGHTFFGPGSRIIITTRNKHLLDLYEVDEIYMVELLNQEEALRLFSWHTFTQDHPIGDYLELSCQVINYAKGLPLALEILGSFLYKRSIPEWESEVNKLKKITNKQIQDVLRISYDDLDDNEKDIFLDIACFFKGMCKEFVTDLLESCGFEPRIGIAVLIDRSLITVSNNMLWMHDLIQAMGKEIVRQESPKDLGKRSRLWFHEDIYKVLIENKVTETIEGIMLSMPLAKELHVSVDAFVKMKKLRVLKLNDVKLSGRLTFLSNELSYLNWDGYPERSLPSNFHPEKIVHLRLRCSQIKQIWTGVKFLDKLKFLDLSHSVYLEKTSDLSSLPSLEILNLAGCTNLVEVHSSIGVHERLIRLDLKDCKNLRSFPRSINLKSLNFLSLTNCSKLDKFPDIEGDMDCLRELHLSGSGIKDLPSSIEFLNGLTNLSLSNCKRLVSLTSNIWKLKCLSDLHLVGCLKLKKFPEVEGTIPDYLQLMNNLSGGLCTLSNDCNFLSEGRSIVNHISGLGCCFSFSSLRSLDLSRNNFFTKIPESVIQLSRLESLILDYCSSLQILTSLPSSIQRVSAHECTSLEGYWFPPSIGCSNNRHFLFTECHKLIGNLRNSVPNLISESQLQEIGQIGLPGSEIPNWFKHRSRGSCNSVSLQADPYSCSRLKGIAVCVVFEIGGMVQFFKFDLKVNGYTICVQFPCKMREAKNIKNVSSDHIILFHRTHYDEYDDIQPCDHDSFGPPTGPIRNLTCKANPGAGPPIYDGCDIEVVLKVASSPLKVKEWGIHLVLEEQHGESDRDPTTMLSKTLGSASASAASKNFDSIS